MNTKRHAQASCNFARSQFVRNLLGHCTVPPSQMLYIERVGLIKPETIAEAVLLHKRSGFVSVMTQHRRHIGA